MSANSVKEAVRIVDAEHSLEDYVKLKCKHDAKFFNIELTRAFISKEAIASVIKCVHSFNQHGVQDALMNKKIGIEHPR